MNTLSTTELAVLRMIADGCSTDDIAAAVFLAPSSVLSTVKRLRAAIGARNEAHAVAIGYRTGLLVDDIFRAPCPACGRAL